MESYIIKSNRFAISLNVEKSKIYIDSIRKDNCIYLSSLNATKFTECYFLGGIYNSRNFGRLTECGEEFEFKSFEEKNHMDYRTYIITEENESYMVKTIIDSYKNSDIFTFRKELTNKTSSKKLLEAISPLTLEGLLDDETLPIFYEFSSSHSLEYSVNKIDISNTSLDRRNHAKRTNRIIYSSNISQNTSNYLPFGIIENKNKFCAFELETYGGWTYNVSLVKDRFTLSIPIKSMDIGYYKTIKPGETHKTTRAIVSFGESLDDVSKSLTSFRRCDYDLKSKPYESVYYNNFMHNAFAAPTEELDRKYIDIVRDYDVNYYSLDAGWHDTRRNGLVTREIGNWDENLNNYPSGIKSISKYAKDAHMKMGIWIEIQGIGVDNTEPPLSDACFFKINGTPIASHGRYQLDFSIKQVRNYCMETVSRIIDAYDIKYIKFDYNQYQYGTDSKDGSIAYGLEKHKISYYKWLKDLRKKYPDIYIEGCASGGMEADYISNKAYDLYSLSDLEEYEFFPFLNINSSFTMLPERAGVWVMPVNIRRLKTSKDEVIYNVISSLFHSMHLSSKLEYLNEEEKELLKEGIDIYKKLASIKSDFYPIYPKGLPNLKTQEYVEGYRYKKKIFLNVYNNSDYERVVEIDLTRYSVKDVNILYPSKEKRTFNFEKGILKVKLASRQAVSFECSTK